MSRKQYRWLLGLTALVLGVMLGIAVWRTPAPPVEVAAAAAGCEDVFNSVTVKGTVRARREGRVTVGQPAQVEEVYVAPGDEVTAGTPVLRVSYTLADMSSQAAAAVSAFLEESSVAAPASGTILYADMDGTVAQTPAVGDLLIPGVTAVRVADLSKLTVEAKVPELYAGELAVGQPANITPISAPDRTLAASVGEIAPYAVQTFQLTGGTAATVLCTLSFKDTADGLLPGSTVDVKLFTDQIADAVTIPYAAVRQDGVQEYVFVVDETGAARRRAIQTGYQLSRGVQVKSGLSAGEIVVTDNEAVLSDGQQVTLHANP